MKKFLINTTSSTLSAAVVAGALLLGATPAKANNDGMNQLIQMLQVFATLEGVMNGNSAQQNTNIGNGNIQNTGNSGNTSLSRCGYFTNVEYSGSQATITKMNRCTGEVVERTVKNRYND
jgi:hypothetical protein